MVFQFFNAFIGVLMLRFVFNVFPVMFAKTSLLFCSSCIWLFFTNYVYVVPYGVLRIFDAIIRVSKYGLLNPAGS